MSKQSPTVLEFIQNGKTTGTATSVEFEGFAVRGDEGNGLRFFKTSAKDTASQTPVQRGGNSFTDASGYVYELNNGSVIYYNGSNNWFPNLGSSGVGTYTSTPASWNIASVSQVNTDIEWDFEYVANDSLRLRSGYGNASNELDFSRASNTESINKSSVAETLSIDKAGITRGGIECYSGYANKLEYSKTISNAVWTKVNVTIYTDSIGDIFNDGNASGEHFVTQSSAQSHADGLSSKIRVKDISGNLSVRLRLNDSNGFIGAAFFDFSTESFYSVSANLDVKYEKLADGSFYLNVKSNLPTSSSPQISIYSVPRGTTKTVYTGVNGSFYVINTQIADSSFYLPLKTSVTASEVRSPEVISASLMNNMPAAGDAFTIEVGAPVPIGGNRCVFNIETEDPSVLFILRRVSPDVISLQFDDSDGSDKGVTVNGVDDTPHNFTVVYDGVNELSLYVDGVKRAYRNDNGNKSYDINGLIYIASRGGNTEQLNSTVKYLRIKQSALSQAQIESRGGYKE